ncbi:hypothetical protein JYT58_00030 [bacterium AH-315-G11]|nr:hypothetical protein [bacterium AH-315-G11]
MGALIFAVLFLVALSVCVSYFVYKLILMLIKKKKSQSMSSSKKTIVFILCVVLTPFAIVYGYKLYLTIYPYFHPDTVLVIQDPQDYPEEKWKYALKFSGKRIWANHPGLIPGPRYYKDVAETMYLNSLNGRIEAKDLSLTRGWGSSLMPLWIRDYYLNQYLKGYIEFRKDGLFVDLRLEKEDQISISRRGGNVISGGHIKKIFAPDRGKTLARLNLKKNEKIVIYNKCIYDYGLSTKEIESKPDVSIVYRGKLGDFTSGHQLRKIFPNLKAHNAVCASLPSRPNLHIGLENNAEDFEFSGLIPIKKSQ